MMWHEAMMPHYEPGKRLHIIILFISQCCPPEATREEFEGLERS